MYRLHDLNNTHRESLTHTHSHANWFAKQRAYKSKWSKFRLLTKIRTNSESCCYRKTLGPIKLCNVYYSVSRDIAFGKMQEKKRKNKDLWTTIQSKLHHTFEQEKEKTHLYSKCSKCSLSNKRENKKSNFDFIGKCNQNLQFSKTFRFLYYSIFTLASSNTHTHIQSQKFHFRSISVFFLRRNIYVFWGERCGDMLCNTWSRITDN